ncbi:MAG: hypothetical protein KGI98_03900 [Euryarchaeota archaeon]|nr:hypothetical protein [Euryarchaeota archaeon]
MNARTLTLSENAIRVAASLLGSTPGTVRQRVRASGLSDSSYRLAQKRLYESGLVEDRYLPVPSALGLNRVSFVLARPFTDRIQETSQLISSEPGAVVVLTGTQLVLGTVFHASEEGADQLRARLSSHVGGGVLAFLSLDPKEPRVPVYYDFEGAWAHFVGLRGTVHYPRPLPIGPGPSRWGRRASLIGASASLQLLRRPFPEMNGGRPSHLAGPATLPGSQRRLLEHGLVEWRVSLHPGVVPKYDNRSIAHLIMTRGTLRDQDGLPDLFSVLVGRCGVFPFLVASDGSQVLIGSLGTGLQAGAQSPHRAVLSTISRHLGNLEVVREPMESVRAPLWQRYDRLLLGAAAA